MWLNFLLWFLIRQISQTKDILKYKMQNPRTTPSGTKVEFTPKYIIVGGEGEVSNILLRVQSSSFGN